MFLVPLEPAIICSGWMSLSNSSSFSSFAFSRFPRDFERRRSDCCRFFWCDLDLVETDLDSACLLDNCLGLRDLFFLWDRDLDRDLFLDLDRDLFRDLDFDLRFLCLDLEPDLERDLFFLDALLLFFFLLLSFLSGDGDLNIKNNKLTFYKFGRKILNSQKIENNLSPVLI